MESIESSYRGFVLTGNESRLDTYADRVSRIPILEDQVQRLTSDNPLQQSRIPGLRKLSAAKIKFGQSAIDLRRKQGYKDGVNLIDSDQGQRIFNDFESTVRKLQEEELQLLAKRNAEVKRLLFQTSVSLVFGTLLAIGIAAAAAWSLQKESTRRSETQRALRVSEQRLRAILEAAPDSFIVVSQSGQIASVNRQAELQFGYNRVELEGASVESILPGKFFHSLGRQLGKRWSPQANSDLPPNHTDLSGPTFGRMIELLGVTSEEIKFPVEVIVSPVIYAEGAFLGRLNPRHFGTAQSRRAAGPYSGRTQAIEHRTSAACLRRVSRPAGAFTHGGQLHTTPG